MLARTVDTRNEVIMETSLQSHVHSLTHTQIHTSKMHTHAPMHVQVDAQSTRVNRFERKRIRTRSRLLRLADAVCRFRTRARSKKLNSYLFFYYYY